MDLNVGEETAQEPKSLKTEVGIFPVWRLAPRDFDCQEPV
jgi:hypothetical protein